MRKSKNLLRKRRRKCYRNDYIPSGKSADRATGFQLTAKTGCVTGSGGRPGSIRDYGEWTTEYFYEKFGCVHKWEQSFASEEKMQDIIQQIVGRHNRVVNLSNPIVDTRLSDGSRVNIVLSPISLDGSAITIRKFPEHPLDMETLIEKGLFQKKLLISLNIWYRQNTVC